MTACFRRRRVLAAGLAALTVWLSPLATPADREAPARARRLIAAAPHLTELVYYAGGGDLLTAVAPFADFPPAAQPLPSVGGHGGLNIEAVLAKRPDLVLVWKSGTPVWQIEQLRAAGVPVWVSEIRRLEDIPAWLREFGRVTGRVQQAESAAGVFTERLRLIEKRAQGRQPRRVFIQVLDYSLFTLSDRHVVSDALRRCGGSNVIGNPPALAPRVDIETVLAADPEIIIAGGDPRRWQEWRARWQRYPKLSAVKRDRLVFIPADLLHRPGPRLLDGMERICNALGG